MTQTDHIFIDINGTKKDLFNECSRNLDYHLIFKGLSMGVSYNPDIISSRPDLELDILLQYPEMWKYLNWDIISGRSDLTSRGLKYGNDLWFVRHKNMWPYLSWKIVSIRHDMNIDVIVKYPEIWDYLHWDIISVRYDTTFDKVIYYVQIWHYINWSLLSYRNDFTFHRIKDYPELYVLFDWKVLTSRRDIHPLHIKYHPKLPWNISELTKRTDIDFETIEIISKNRNIDIINFKIIKL